MNNITEHIRNGRSVRTYDGRDLDKNDIEKLTALALTAKENNLNVVFEKNDPKFESSNDVEYIASYRLV